MDLPAHRLNLFLRRQYPQSTFKQITGDASLRRYFRIKQGNETLIAAVYPLPFERHNQTFLLATEFFQSHHLPVPKIIAESGPDGIILLEDFGQILMTDWLQSASLQEQELALKKAIDLIIKIQETTDQGLKDQAVVVRQKFDFDKLFWELNYFYIHYLRYFRKFRIEKTDEKKLFAELQWIAENLAPDSQLVVHRDFHVANLMIKKQTNLDLGLIDYQDARLGPVSYDLVPLLTERLKNPLTDEKIDQSIDYFLEERKKTKLKTINRSDFIAQFWLADLQRALKVLGTFGYMTAVNKRPEYRHFIPGTLKEVQRALTKIDHQFPILTQVLNLS